MINRLLPLWRSINKRLLGLLVIASLVAVYPATIKHARADEPITIGTVTVIVVVGGSVVGGVVALWRYFTDDDEPVVKYRVYYNSAGEEIRREKIEPARSPAIVQVPADFPELNGLPDFKASDKTVLDQVPSGGVQLTTDMSFEGDVMKSAGDYLEYEIERVASFQMHRPPELAKPGARSEATIDIDLKDLIVATTDVAGTNGSAYVHIEVRSPQLGSLYSSSARVTQGGSLELNGDIPRSAFSTGPGVGTGNYQLTKKLVIPPHLDQIDVEVVIRNGGDGFKTGAGPSTSLILSVIALVTALIALLVIWIVLKKQWMSLLWILIPLLIVGASFYYFAARGYQTGKAVVVGAPSSLGCSPTQMTRRANGCSHSACTTAKRRAVTALVAAVQPQACRRYVQQSRAPCRKFNCP